MVNQIIGVSGVAGSGKDTFFSLLSQTIPCKQYSLASALKTETSNWCKLHYRIDPATCSRGEKEIVRPFLVAHGTTKRKLTEGRHWIDILNEVITKDKFNGVKVITDIRYDDYNNDEVSWLQEELNGVLVHISQYTWEDSISKRFRAPVNSEEARNDPKLKQKSDFQVEWEFLENGQIDELSPYVDDFIRWLSLKEKGRNR